MQRQEEDKLIKAQLLGGVEINEIVTNLDVSRSRVMRLQREVENSLSQGEIEKLVQEDLVQGGSLAVLQSTTQQAALAVINKAKIMASTAETAGELETIGKTVTDVYKAFFVSSNPQVNIQNNFPQAGESKYETFLSDTPGINDH